MIAEFWVGRIYKIFAISLSAEPSKILTEMPRESDRATDQSRVIQAFHTSAYAWTEAVGDRTMGRNIEPADLRATKSNIHRSDHHNEQLPHHSRNGYPCAHAETSAPRLGEN